MTHLYYPRPQRWQVSLKVLFTLTTLSCILSATAREKPYYSKVNLDALICPSVGGDPISSPVSTCAPGGGISNYVRLMSSNPPLVP